MSRHACLTACVLLFCASAIASDGDGDDTDAALAQRILNSGLIHKHLELLEDQINEGELFDQKQKAFMDDYYQHLDKDGDGAVRNEELLSHFHALRELRRRARARLTKHVTQSFKDMDKNQDGHLTVEEFDKVFLDDGLSAPAPEDQKWQGKAHHEHADSDGDGLVSQDELLAAWHSSANDDARELLRNMSGDDEHSEEYEDVDFHNNMMEDDEEQEHDEEAGEEEGSGSAAVELKSHEREIQVTEKFLDHVENELLATIQHHGHDADKDGALSKDEVVGKHRTWYNSFALLFGSASILPKREL